MSAVSVSGTARLVEVAGRAVDAVLEASGGPRRAASGRSRPRTAGSRRRARRWRATAALGQARHEAGEQLAHRRLGQRLEVERGEVALAGAPVRALLEQLRAGQRDDVDRDAAAPLEEVVDEVEQARCRRSGSPRRRGRPGPSPASRSKNVRQAPNSCSEPTPDLDAEQGEQRRLDPAPLVGVGRRAVAQWPRRPWPASSPRRRSRRGRHRPRTISPSAQKLIPSP